MNILLTSTSINAIVYTYILLSETVMSQLKQCTDLTAKQDFNFKNPETNRTIKVREGGHLPRPKGRGL